MRGMRKRGLLGRLLLVAALALSSLVPASAAQYLPPTPTWWPAGGYNLRPGNWISCNDGKWAVNDCIESVEVKAKDSDEWQKMKFAPNPKFNFETTRAIRFNDETKNDYTYLPSPEPGVIGHDGLWMPPAGIKTDDKNQGLVVESGFWGGPNPGGYFQLFLRTKYHFDSLYKDLIYRVKIRTEALYEYARWQKFPSQRADLEWGNSEVTYTASPGIFYWPAGDWDAMCAGKYENPRAEYELSIVEFELQIWNNERNQYPPGQLTIATNGLQCFEGLQFDETDKTLKVRVGTVHYDSKGNVIEGWFSALIAKELLVKWWGFNPSSNTGEARLELYYENGERVVATTVSNYIQATRQLKIFASGFHYSTPYVKIRFVEKDAISNPASNLDLESSLPNLGQTVKSNKKILCKKGNRKSISVKSSKCPKGYKKVS